MAPAKKKLSGQEQRDAKKAAKQKKLLIFLAPVLLVAVALQLPKLLGGDEEAAPTETSAVEGAESGEPASADGSSPGDAPGAVPPVAPGAPGDPFAGAGGIGAVPTVARLAEVSDSDPLAAADISELISFSTFVGNDPFVQLVEAPPAAEESSAPEGGDKPGSDDPGAAPGDPGTVDTLAILEINGEQEVVQVGDPFPADDPAFKLVSIDGEAAIAFGLVEGSFSSGIETLDLETGKSITLVSQPDGFRYTIRLVQITADAGAIEGLPAPAAPAQ